MVFSGGSDTESVKSSQYGIINVDIKSSPLIDGTTVKDHIVFDCDVQVYNCISTTLSSILNNLQNEILTKVDILLTPFNGQVNDSHPPNISVPTTGLGTVDLSVHPTRLISGTSNPNEIVFTVYLQLANCNRSRLVNILNGLNNEIIDKVNDVL